MERLQDELLAQIFRELPLYERARLASVCRRWRTVSTSTHAAVVWQTLCLDETELGQGACLHYGSLVRWCHQRGRHIRELEIALAEDCAHADFEDGSTCLLTNLCTILLATSSQLQRLSVDPWLDDDAFSLLRPLMSMVSMASSLEYLAVNIPFNRGIGPLAESVPSLRHLKVANIVYTENGAEVCDTAAVEALARALCQCPLLEQLKLGHFYLRCLPAELAAATRLTLLVLGDPKHTQLDITNALPCSLQQLRLTESHEFADTPNDNDEWDVMTRVFRGMQRLQSLQLAARVWAKHRLPPGLTSLRLEAHHKRLYHRDDVIGGISSLSCLEALCLSGFSQLGDWPAEVAAALQPLHRLRALGLDWCKLKENPARDILTRLTLLSLHQNDLQNLPDALPAGMVHNLRLLDIGGNPQLFRQPDSKTWAAEDFMAFDSGWARLQVLGLQGTSPDKGLMATVKLLQRLLQRQADVAKPRQPSATVVYDWIHHEELLDPARELAEIPLDSL